MSKPRSTSVRVADAGDIGVRLEVTDDVLARGLIAALRDHPGLVEADAEGDVTVSQSADGVLLGVVDGPQTVLPSRDPAVILAAAVLLHAGFTIGPRSPASVVPPVRLSQREQQVAALLLEGASNKGIARALGISVHTAKFHVTAVLDKLGARNRADAVSIILREGLIAL